MKPVNEMGVIALFIQQAQMHGYELISIGTRYPDAVVKKDGQHYRVEFEYKASNFKSHKHNPAGADLIICWVNNYPDSPLPVLALENWQESADISAPTRSEQPVTLRSISTLTPELEAQYKDLLSISTVTVREVAPAGLRLEVHKTKLASGGLYYYGIWREANQDRRYAGYMRVPWLNN